MSRFPTTRPSLLDALRSADEVERRRAWDVVAAAYWGPVRMLFERRWGADPDAAADLTQDFFADAIAHGRLERYDPARARFRTFLRVCVDGFASHAREAAGRLKRGGGYAHVALDGDDAALELAAAAAVPDELDALFEREWVRSVLALALERLTAEAGGSGRDRHVELFRQYDVDGADAEHRPTYEALARDYALTATQVTNHLAWARRTFRRHLLDVLRETSGSDAEYRADVRTLLGIAPP